MNANLLKASRSGLSYGICGRFLLQEKRFAEPLMLEQRFRNTDDNARKTGEDSQRLEGVERGMI